MHEGVDQAAAYLRKFIPFRARVGLILGSGLGVVREQFRAVAEIPYGEIPHFPVSTVHGHVGRLIVGRRGAHKVLIMDGRVHRYEGYSFEKVTFPIAVLHKLGVTTAIITNAAGAVNRRLTPGDIMLITDHIDLMWQGVSDVSRSPQAIHKPYYSRRLIEVAREVGARERIPVEKGVLLAQTGPSYETRSEVEFARKSGADAATMSTIPEVTVCHMLGLSVLGLSVITNVAASHGSGHEDVVSSAGQAGHDLGRLIVGILGKI
jgi:purine-nucleoside phosphorylase